MKQGQRETRLLGLREREGGVKAVWPEYGLWAEFRLLLVSYLLGLILWVVPMKTPSGRRLVRLIAIWVKRELRERHECEAG